MFIEHIHLYRTRDRQREMSAQQFMKMSGKVDGVERRLTYSNKSLKLWLFPLICALF